MKSGNNGQISEVENVNTGMPPPPIDNMWPPPPPSPTFLSANAASFVPTSNLLGQARGVLYPQTPMKTQYYQYLPHTYEQNNNYTLMPGGVNMPHSQSMEYQRQQSMGNPTTTTTITSGVVPATTHSISTKPTGNENSHESEGAQPPPWASQMLNRLQQIESHLVSQNSKWNSVESAIQNQNTRMSNMEIQVKELTRHKQEMTNVDIKVNFLSEEVSQMSRKISKYDETINTYSDMCDDTKSDQTASRNMIDDLVERVGKLEFDHDQMQPKLTNMKTEITDLQCRSMRDNLIFTGVTELKPPDQSEGYEDRSEYRENVEHTLTQFLRDEMNIRDEIKFHRVHRINIPDKTDDYPNPIVAKFVNFKDREYVRMQAPKTLRGKHFGVREQFPKVIENRRKSLYPEMRKAKQNKQNKVRLVKDKLYINDIQFIPEDAEYESENYQTLNSNPRRSNQYQSRDPRNRDYQHKSGTWNTSRDYQRGRTFTRSSHRGPPNRRWAPRQPYVGKPADFLSPNIFMNLPKDDDNTSMTGRSESRKNKASSPLDNDKTLKKTCDHELNNTDDNEEPEPIEMSDFSVSGNQNETPMDDEVPTDPSQNNLPAGEKLLNDPHELASLDSDVTENQQGDEA